MERMSPPQERHPRRRGRGLSRRRFRCRAGSSIASAVTILIYVLGALLVLRRAGFPIRWISPGFARWGTWAFVIILTLAALVNFLSQSPRERFLLAPTALLLAALSLIVAIEGTAQ